MIVYHDIVRNSRYSASGLSGEPATFLRRDSRQNLTTLRDSVNGSRSSHNPAGSR